MSEPSQARTLPELRAQVALWRRQGLTVGFVPTMGALHAGHLDLVAHALERCDRAVVSIFVNPTQFAPTEDLDRYPRDEGGDLAKLARVGAHLVWLPAVATMYPEGEQTRVTVGGVSQGLESVTRPHFFQGVATVVAKLLNQVQADIAVFGEKDYQQLLVVRRMALDLAIPTEIVGRPTVREADGLAMSSRNAYLGPAERQVAPSLHRIMQETAHALRDGQEAEPRLEAARRALVEAGFARVDYLELRDAETLAPLDRVAQRPARLLAAMFLGPVRLIDNLAVPAA
ncbi:MAG: pantoate--beta-alanine ligase [Geminicoccaceae bacterium]